MAFGDGMGHDGLTYSGKEFRELVATLSGQQSGVVGGSTALKVTQQTVAAATVKAAAGGVIIPATGAGLGGSYQAWNDADLNSATITPTGSDGRKDRLIIRVTAGVPALEIVQGTASGSPAEPSITGDNYLELALITLPGSTTNITDAMITDRRVRLATGTPVICTSTTRPASPYEGMHIYESDTDREFAYSGTTWVQRAGVPVWVTPTMENSWVSFGGSYQAPRYSKVGDIVTIQGHVKNGSLLTAAFTLPAGSRPAATLTFASIDGAGALGRVDITATGAVAPMTGNTGFFSLNYSFAV